MVMATVAPLAQRGGDVARVQAGDRGGHHRHLLAEAGPQRPVVGLDLDLAQLVGLGDEPELVDVELVADDLRQPLDRLVAPRPVATITAARSGWRTLIFA